jgi:hypothetical protein
MNALRAFALCASVSGLLLAIGTTLVAGNSAGDESFG